MIDLSKTAGIMELTSFIRTRLLLTEEKISKKIHRFSPDKIKI